jgi:HlyD family secretion protein
LLGLLLALAVLAAGWSVTDRMGGRPSFPEIEGRQTFVVERQEFRTVLLAGGDLQAAKQVTVECHVEDVTDSNGTLVLSVVKNGTVVKKGDVLCELDASAMTELAREEQILVNQARAVRLKAQLDLETAQLALREYAEGIVNRSTKEFEARVALGRSDARRQEDRVAWAETMSKKGYLSQGQLLTERQTLAQTLHDLHKAEGQYALFVKYQAPKEIHALKGQIQIAANNDRLEADRLKAHEDELDYLNKQIAACTIRAPQDGVVVHANRGYWWMRPLEPGSRVLQDQPVFLMPDLSRLEVDVSVHESMGPRVRAGMTARVRIASQPDRDLAGKVVAVNMLPTQNWKEWDDNLKHFLVRVRLDYTPISALPFMSATVEIDTGELEEALVIPAEAVDVANGQETCLVVGDEGPVRRVIKTRRATRDLVQVVEGLDEGETVVASYN